MGQENKKNSVTEDIQKVIADMNSSKQKLDKLIEDLEIDQKAIKEKVSKKDYTLRNSIITAFIAAILSVLGALGINLSNERKIKTDTVKLTYADLVQSCSDYNTAINDFYQILFVYDTRDYQANMFDTEEFILYKEKRDEEVRNGLNEYNKECNAAIGKIERYYEILNQYNSYDRKCDSLKDFIITYRIPERYLDYNTRNRKILDSIHKPIKQNIDLLLKRIKLNTPQLRH